MIKINGKYRQSLEGFNFAEPNKVPSQFEEFDPVFNALGIDANPDTLLIYWTNGLSINVQSGEIVDDQNRD